MQGTEHGLAPARATFLREPGRVLLISCYELGHQPWGLASPLGFLERAGFAPEALDLSVQKLDEEQVRRARFVGISVPMHTALRLGVRVAERIRALNSECHVCFFGLYAILNAGFLLAGAADSVLGGEFEGALVARLEGMEREAGDVQASELSPHAPASAFGASRRSFQSAPLDRLDFPTPSRSRLPGLEHYAHLELNGERRLAGYTEASRGCLHHCRHCPIPPVYEGRFFIVPPEIVRTDIRNQIGMGAAHITFGDPDFLNGPGHSLRVVRAMHAEFPSVTFDFTAKVEHLLKRRDEVLELGALGAIFAVTAVESLNDEVLLQLDKGHTGADAGRALSVLREAGIAMRPTFVPFTPWETLRSYASILDFVERADLLDHVDPIQYTLRLLVPPGSGLLHSSGLQPFLRTLDPASFTYGWSHPDPRMDRLQRELATLVAESTSKQEDPPATFYRIRERVRAAEEVDWAGEAPGVGRPVDRGLASDRRLPIAGLESQPQVGPNRRKAPRLTEPWFC